MVGNFQKILIIRTDRIGDVILTLPMARVLKRHSPDVRITMLIQRYTSELVEDDPYINDIVYYDNRQQLVPFFQMVKKLREKTFDVVFHTHPRLRLAVITWLAGIPIRIGTGYRWYSFLFNYKHFEHRKDAEKHELEYNLHLLKTLGCSVNDGDIQPTMKVAEEPTRTVRALLSNAGVRPNHKIVILHPGSGGSSRDWNPNNFGELGKRLGELANIQIVITGRGSERDLVNEVWSSSDKTAIALCDQLTLREYSALIKEASLFVANSTGPIHIAAAVGTPVIGLYPQITTLSAARWGPYTDRKVILSPRHKPPDCKICIRHKTGRCECMDSITVDEVYESAKKFLLE